MAELDDTLAQYSILAIQSAAEDLGIEPMELAKRLNEGEISRLAHLLNAAHRHVTNPGLRHRIEDLLSAVTGGRMPGARAETELDWALKISKRRRSQPDRASVDDPEDEGEQSL